MQSEHDDPQRPTWLEESSRLDTAPQGALDRLAQVATDALRVRAALISLADDGGEPLVKSGYGLPRMPLVDPLSHYIAQNGMPSVIEDAGGDARFQEVRAIEEIGILAYAGVPISLPEGRVVGVLGVFDRDRRKWSAEDLRILRNLASMATDLIQHGRSSASDLIENRRCLLQILDSTGEGIYGIDAEGVCTFVNRKALKLLGFDDEKQMLGVRSHDLIHHTHADGTACPIGDCRIFQAIRNNESVYSKDEVFWKSDGTPLPVEYRSFPVADGGPTRAVITFVDITEQLQRERERDEALTAAQNAAVRRADSSPT